MADLTPERVAALMERLRKMAALRAMFDHPGSDWAGAGEEARFLSEAAEALASLAAENARLAGREQRRLDARRRGSP